jgi:hypothetical protein
MPTEADEPLHNLIQHAAHESMLLAELDVEPVARVDSVLLVEPREVVGVFNALGSNEPAVLDFELGSAAARRSSSSAPPESIAL